MAEALRAASIYNNHELCWGSAFVHVDPFDRWRSGGTFVTAPGRVINPRRPDRPWHQNDSSLHFWGEPSSARSRDADALEKAFAFAIELTGVPRDQWVLEPWGGRRGWVPKPVLDAKVAWALENPKQKATA